MTDYGFADDNQVRLEIEHAWAWMMNSKGKSEQEWDGVIKGLSIMVCHVSPGLRDSVLATLNEATMRKNKLFGSM